MIQAKSDIADPSDPMNVIGEIDVGGPEGENLYKIVKHARWKKTSEWLAKPETLLGLKCAGLAMNPALRLM
eukprot:8436561-Pyramimonas_sp.AAC.1